MIDPIHVLTVLLTEPIRDEDAQPLIAAIRQLRGVAEVLPHVAGVDAVWAKATARRELAARRWKVLEGDA